MRELREFGNPLNGRIRGSPFGGGDKELTVNVHKSKFNLVPSRFGIGISIRVKLNEDGPSTSNHLRPLEGEGGIFKGGVVSDQEGDDLVVIETINTGWKVKTTKSGLRLFAPRPGPIRTNTPTQTTPKSENHRLAPIFGDQVPAGYEATLVCDIIARVGNSSHRVI